jgi:hypothetical protein
MERTMLPTEWTLILRTAPECDAVSMPDCQFAAVPLNEDLARELSAAQALVPVDLDQPLAKIKYERETSPIIWVQHRPGPDPRTLQPLLAAKDRFSGRPFAEAFFLYGKALVQTSFPWRGLKLRNMPQTWIQISQTGVVRWLGAPAAGQVRLFCTACLSRFEARLAQWIVTSPQPYQFVPAQAILGLAVEDD